MERDMVKLEVGEKPEKQRRPPEQETGDKQGENQKGTVREMENGAPSLVSWNPGARVEPSVTASVPRSNEGRRKRLDANKNSEEQLFWLRNCHTQWKLINAKLELAGKQRQRKAKKEMVCTVLAIVKQQGELLETQARLDNDRYKDKLAMLHQQLDPAAHVLSRVKTELFETVTSLNQAITRSLEQVPLLDGAVLGERPQEPDIHSFINALNYAESALQKFSDVLPAFAPRRDRATQPGTPNSDRKKKECQMDPLVNLTATATAGSKLGAAIIAEVELMQEIADLIVQKHQKLLRLNSMRVHQTQSKTIGMS